MATHTPRANPLRWEELTTSERRGAASEISRIGKQTASGSSTAIAKLHAASEGMSSSEDYRAKTASMAGRLEAVQPHLRDKPITMKGATSRRVQAWDRAVASAQESGSSLPGAGWYLEHAESIHAVRGSTPFPQAAAASAALSPGKDPKADELPAFRVLSELHHQEHTVTRARGKETQAVSSMSAEQLGRHVTTAASENSRGGKRSLVSSHPEFHVAGRAHHPNTVKSIKVMRGQIGGQEANPPSTAPKTASYERSIVSAGTASSAETLDYRGIAHHAVHGGQGQGMFQYSQSSPGGPAESSILSPEHHTAEDTWMQAVSSGQKLSARYPGGRMMSPAKRVVDKGGPGETARFSKRNAGIRRDPMLTKAGVVHAFNNKATRTAAAEVSGRMGSFNQHGEDIKVPSVMMQEVAWTQARRDAGGDAPFNRQRRQETFQASTSSGQRKLF